ncbi:lysylphosphatidylglycerol synthase transmembrane domain-containing protein [Solitalea lacus]|uniref:lysylphosphatidylglycerol synthase transmembrane domain-containing protein n=1 Tax=Solitalea lacus TaxID=2911172 RepID=UPI001EDB77D1|nr:lysylphosphatidylglycerol synthase transmembrane domain-containing protein [Solitalea lacus]UKJ07559.1 flippase-like domain-containing protein [Solitalea lacus]
MNQSIKSVLQYSFFIGLGVAMLYLAFKGQDISLIMLKLKSANFYWVAISAIVTMVAHYVRAVRWNMLIEPLGHKPKSSNTFIAVLVGYAANLAFPRLGEVVRCGTLTKTDKVPMDKLIGTVIVERVVDLLSLIAILVLTVLLQFDRISSFVYDNLLKGIIEKLTGNTSMLIVAVGVSIGLLVLSIIIFKKYKHQVYQSAIGKKIMGLLEGISHGLASIGKLKSSSGFLLYTFLLWVLYLFSTYTMFFALSPTSSLTLLTALFVLTVGSLGMAAPVQGGLGAFHWIVSKGLILYGIAEIDGLAYATISHGTQTLMIIIFGSLGFFSLLFTQKSNIKARSVL